MKKIFFIFLILFFLILPNFTNALLSSFGGKVENYNPNHTGCEAITNSINTALNAIGISVEIKVEELKISPPKGGSFGILKVNEITVMPFETNVKLYRSYIGSSLPIIIINNSGLENVPNIISSLLGGMLKIIWV